MVVEARAVVVGEARVAGLDNIPTPTRGEGCHVLIWIFPAPARELDSAWAPARELFSVRGLTRRMR